MEHLWPIIKSTFEGEWSLKVITTVTRKIVNLDAPTLPRIFGVGALGLLSVCANVRDRFSECDFSTGRFASAN